MCIATAEDVAAFELLVVELELSCAASVAAASVATCKRDHPVVPLEQVGDGPLVVDEAPLPRIFELAR